MSDDIVVHFVDHYHLIVTVAEEEEVCQGSDEVISGYRVSDVLQVVDEQHYQCG